MAGFVFESQYSFLAFKDRHEHRKPAFFSFSCSFPWIFHSLLQNLVLIEEK